MNHAKATLRPYQSELKGAIYRAWNDGASNVLAVLPTGAGKTVIFSDIIHDHTGASCAIAHRQELVTQISLALARDHVRHRIIGPKNVVKLCVESHMKETGRSYYDPRAVCAVAGVDTLVRRTNLAEWFSSVTLWVQDEGHHLLKKNKWGRAVELFPNARGLGVTATAFRADGNGLGRHADGVFDILIEGERMRPLITSGYLADYRIFAPPLDLDLSNVPIGGTGDFNPQQLKKAVRKSRIVGDVIEHYKRIAFGKLGVTFAESVETATDIANKYCETGIPAEVVSANTSDADRISALRRFQSGVLWQLVNVDLFGEGFDVPSIEVVSMARPTHSYTLYAQQFGRALRPLAGKDYGIIIDHVSNVERHGLPDTPRIWSLDRREKRSTNNLGTVPVRACPGCTAVYERTLRACPYCGFVPVPTSRSGPEFVDGDLSELSPDTLAMMRGEIAAVDVDKEAYRTALNSRHVPVIGQLAHVKRHVERQEAQSRLRDSIALWAGHQRAAGRPDWESYRRFYFLFGVDVMTAQALGTTDAELLTANVGAAI